MMQEDSAQNRPPALTAEPTTERQVDSSTFPIRKVDHDAAVDLFKIILLYQATHPELYYYTRSRSFFRTDPDNPDLEIWMFIDEYDNRDAYWRSLLNAVSTDPQSAANRQAFEELVAAAVAAGGQAPSGRHDVWTELQELRVQYLQREPLWPGCSGNGNEVRQAAQTALSSVDGPIAARVKLD